MTFTKLDIAPAEAGLAVNHPSGNLHGHEAHIMEITRYWGKVRQKTRGSADTIRFDIAQPLGEQLREVMWRMRFGDKPVLFSTSETSIDKVRDTLEVSRRRLLGLAALSDLTKLLIDTEEGSIPHVNTPDAGEEVDIILDIYTEEDRPFNPRVHLGAADADGLLDQQLGDATQSWHRHDTGLLVKRTTLDMSPTMGMHVQVDGHTMAASGMHTLFPYLPARPSR